MFGGGSAPFYAVYFKALRLPRDAFRATITMVMLMQAVMRIGGYAGMGLFDATVLLPLAVGLPFMLAGGWVGDAIVDGASPVTFNRIIGSVLLLGGVALITKCRS